ncbi:MAG: DUF4286 family protein [Chloroflexota bacterium]
MAKKGRGILLVYTDIDEKYDEEFNAWYDTQHLPQLLSIPGMLAGARYTAVKGGPKYLAAYELESVDVLQTPAFKDRVRPPWDARMSPSIIGKNYARVVAEQIFPDHVVGAERGMAPVLQIGRMSVGPEVDAEWNAWYNGEYIPAYLKVPGVISSRRYRVVEGSTRYTTMYEFASVDVPESAAWNEARLHSSPKNIPMRDAMEMAPGSPGVYRRMGS